jgi:hypothetical protein
MSNTIGYHGTIVRLDHRSLDQNRDDPGAWQYVVFVPHFRDCINVARRNLMVTGGFDLEPLPQTPCNVIVSYRFYFEKRPHNDLEVVCGYYLLPGRDWDRFRFVRSDVAETTGEVRAPFALFRCQTALLHCRVPRAATIDREFARKTMCAFVGPHPWCEVNPTERRAQ